jgi:hypothetical protein
MPQLVLFAALGAGAYAGFRWLKKTAAAMASDIRAAEATARERQGAVAAKDLGTLEFDPKSGVYKPVGPT